MMSKFIVLAAAGATASLGAIEEAEALKLNIFGLRLSWSDGKKSSLTEKNLLGVQGSRPGVHRQLSSTASDVSKYRTRSVSPNSSISGSAKSAASSRASTVRSANLNQLIRTANSDSRSAATASSRSVGGARTVTRSVPLAARAAEQAAEAVALAEANIRSRRLIKIRYRMNKSNAEYNANYCSTSQESRTLREQAMYNLLNY